MKAALSFLLIFNLVVPLSYAGETVERYQVPDVRNDYCGVAINFQYCKCAFHNEYCKDIGLSRSEANNYVLNEFRTWNKERIQMMGQNCLQVGGNWDKSNWSCTTCTEGDLWDGSSCVAPDKVDAGRRECNEALKKIDTEWEKYSDFYDRLGTDVSYEVQQFNATLDHIASLVARLHELEYNMAIAAELRLEMRAYKAALVQNIRNNITKAIFRLAWVTYNTVQGARGTAGSVQKMLSPENAVEGIGATMKVIQAHIPPSEKSLQIDTSNTTGKIKSIAWNSTLEAIESVVNPVEVAKQVMKDLESAIAGGPDISEVEVAVLREQHLSNKAVDEALAESYAESAATRVELIELKLQITQKYNDLQEWKVKEYQRVKANLEDQCREK